MDEGISALALATLVVGTDDALTVVLLVADVLEFGAMVTDTEIEEAKGGGGTTSVGLASAPVP